MLPWLLAVSIYFIVNQIIIRMAINLKIQDCSPLEPGFSQALEKTDSSDFEQPGVADPYILKFIVKSNITVVGERVQWR